MLISNNIDIKNENNQIASDKISNDEVLFALDIGTRSVVGMVCISREESFEILDYEQIYHQIHAMHDGQIEDIELVSNAINKVKKTLEKRANTVFTKVSVAAAGRSLKTSRAQYEQELDENEIITQSQLHSLEYSAVNLAQEKFLAENADEIDDDYFCVGYSVVKNILDGYTFSNLEGHKGKNVKLDIIAAFLPHNVARSLYTVTSMNNLDVDNLTLEPIAAINVIVPKDIRLLNIAIVDIGAGTSDIAISKNGSIVAYGMVVVAGDEITETIMRTFLTDFETAEKVKITHSQNPDEIEFLDILGNKHIISSKDIDDAIEPTIDNLCRVITEEIVNLNETSPMAVFLVGGGCQVKGLCDKVAANLNMPIERVSVGGKQPFKNIKLCSDALLNPEYVTPIGVGLISSLHRGCNFFSVTINNRKVMLLNQGAIKAMDALLLAGLKPSKLIGLSSPGISYSINGEHIHKRGNPPQNGLFTVNGEPATIDMMVKQGDVIVALPAENGVPHNIKLTEIGAEFIPLRVILDTEDITAEHKFLVNGKQVQNDYIISDKDEITAQCPKTIRELLAYLKREIGSKFSYKINKVDAELDSPIETGDIITSKRIEEVVIEKPKQKEQQKDENNNNNNNNDNNDNNIESYINVNINGEWKKIAKNVGLPVNFYEIINYADIDTEKPQGMLILKLNQKEASYTDEVKSGDYVIIKWEK